VVRSLLCRPADDLLSVPSGKIGTLGGICPAWAFTMTGQRRRQMLLGCGFGIVLLIVSALCLHLPGSIWAGTLLRKDAIVGLMVAATVLYFAAVGLVMRALPDDNTLWLVIGVALAMRAALLVSPPFMSTDVYRYVWDGRVQAAGINPYRYVPADPALATLRDLTIYPNINRATYAHTIYPPAAQVIFAAVGRISQTVWATKLALLLLEAAGMAATLGVLRIAGLPSERLLIYAWNPLAAWSVAGGGHIDGAAIGLLGLALLARVTRRHGLAGALLAGAILTKLLPLAVAPALWRRWGWRFPAACICTVAALYACYSGVGWRVLGFLPSYTTEEGLSSGSGFWILRLLGTLGPLPSFASVVYVSMCSLGLGATAFWIAFRQHPPTVPNEDAIRVCGNVSILAAATMMAMSPHYPWYYAWLALPSVIKPWRSVIFLSAASVFLYSDPFHACIAIPTLVFVPTLLLAAYELNQFRKARTGVR
jgi:alpha-1,6-mannosyltransferase